MRLSPHELRRLSVTGLITPETARRCYAGDPVRVMTRLRIERAARELGLPPPPAPKQAATSRMVQLSAVPVPDPSTSDKSNDSP